MGQLDTAPPAAQVVAELVSTLRPARAVAVPV
jgi:hypothetical protein